MTSREGCVGKLPNGWLWTTIGEISSRVQYGYTASACRVGVGPKFLRITDIQNGSVDWETVPICKIDREDARKFRLKSGDIVFARTGATVGKSYLIMDNTPEAIFASYLIRIALSDKLDKKYVYYFFQSPQYWIQISTGKAGIGQPNVNATKLESLRIPLTPLPEQHRIVSKIEELLTKIDSGVKALKRAKQLLKLYRESLLSAAFEGRLTQGWRSKHPGLELAEKLLADILHERKDNWGRSSKAGNRSQKYPEPAKPEVDGLPEIPPGRWTWASLEQLTDATRPISYGVIKLGSHMERGVPTLRSSNVRHLLLELEDIKKISHALSGQYSRTVLRGGEVLITIRGTLGGVVATPSTCKGFNISREVAMISPLPLISSECLAVLMASNAIQNWLSRRTKGIAYTGINLETLRYTPIPVMSIDEQEEIAQIVKRQLSVVDEIKNRIDVETERAANIRQVILRKAFSGGLVPQDDTDEPASRLLERIKAEKAKQFPLQNLYQKRNAERGE